MTNPASENYREQWEAFQRIRELTEEYHPGSTNPEEALTLARAFVRPSTVRTFQAAAKKETISAASHDFIRIALDARLRMEGIMAELLDDTLGDILDTWDAMLDPYGEALAILTPEEYGEATRVGAFCSVWNSWREKTTRDHL